MSSLFLLIFSITFILSSLLLHQYRDSPQVKRALFETSLLATKWTQHQWWNEIPPYNIVLGGIPLRNEEHHLGIREAGVTSILSMVESFEHESGFWDEPMRLDEWREMGMRVKSVEAVDFSALEERHFLEAIAFLEQELALGHKVYIHCKAGRGRSASIVIAYLMKTDGMDFDDALRRVSSFRPQVNINEYQKAAILSYVESLKKLTH